MFGSTPNTTDLMLPILLDMANLIRRAVRPGKETREVLQPYPLQLLRRSDTQDSDRIHPALRHTHVEKNINDLNESTEPTIQGNNQDNAGGKVTTAQILRRLRSKENASNAKPLMPKLLRRSYTEDNVDDDLFELGVQPASTQTARQQSRRTISQSQKNTITTPNLNNNNNTKQVDDRENLNITNDVDNVSSALI